MIDLLKPYFERKANDLTLEERNILCLAYKNAVGMRRIAWRAATAVQKIGKYEDKYTNETSEYQKKLESELVDMCKDMLNLITKHLMPKAKKGGKVESEAFYFKLQGDYFRYVAEVGEGDRLEKATGRALDCYNKGIEKAEQLSPADPTRLSLLLNFAVFCYENIDQKEQAVEMANQAYEDALSDIDKIDRSKAQESATILEFIRENLNLWKQKGQGEGPKNFFSQHDSEAQFINQDEEGFDNDDY